MKKLVLITLFTSALVLLACQGLSYDNSSSDDDIASDNVLVFDNSIRYGEALDSDDIGTPCDGARWKPESEADGALVVLSKAGDIIPWESISASLAIPEEDGTVLEFAVYNGVSVFSDGPAQVWRFGMPGTAYDGRYEIEYDGKVCEGVVRDPGERNF